MNQLLSVDASALLLGISPFTVRLYVRTGKLRPVRIGRRILISENELSRFVEAATVSHEEHS